jgi:hypothetical protein
MTFLVARDGRQISQFLESSKDLRIVSLDLNRIEVSSIVLCTQLLGNLLTQECSSTTLFSVSE